MIITYCSYNELIRLTTTKFGEKVLLAFKHPYLSKVGFNHFVDVLKDGGFKYESFEHEQKVVIDKSELYFKSFADQEDTNKIRGLRFSSIIVHELSGDVCDQLSYCTSLSK